MRTNKLLVRNLKEVSWRQVIFHFQYVIALSICKKTSPFSGTFQSKLKQLNDWLEVKEILQGAEVSMKVKTDKRETRGTNERLVYMEYLTGWEDGVSFLDQS